MADLEDLMMRQRLPHINLYQSLLMTDAGVAKIAYRCVLEEDLHNADFLYLRAVALQGPETFSQVVCLLDDILATLLGTLADAFSRYYSLPLENVAAAALWALMQAINTITPEILAAATRDGLPWRLFLCDLIKTGLWGKLIAGFFDTTPLDDKEFKRIFEAEWNDLLLYRNPLYGFHVTPKLPLWDFVRYQELKSGRPDIRNMISTFLAHNAKGYPHFITAWAPNFAHAAFAKPLRRIYAPLIERVVQTVLKNMSVEQAQRERIAEDIRKKAWEQYDQAWEAFEFHVPYSGRPSPLGRLGVLGLAESETERQSFDAFLEAGGREMLAGIAAPEATVNESVDITPYLFSFFMQSRLESWVKKHYPADKKTAPTASLDAPLAPGEERTRGETLAGERGWAIDANAILREEPAFRSAEGAAYLTIQQVARQQGATLSQLRYLETCGLYQPRRAKEVAGSCPPLGETLRLYPDTSEEREKIMLALLRVATRSSELAGEELTRKAAASKLGIAPSQLRSWEKAGKIKPLPRGRAVVYTAECLAQAQILRDEKLR